MLVAAAIPRAARRRKCGRRAADAFKAGARAAMLADCVRRVCEVDRLGGEVIVRDHGTCILCSCEALCSTQLDEIVRRHPRLSFVVRSSDPGFVVVFSEEGHRSPLLSADFFAVLVSCMVAAVGVSLLT